MPGLDFVLVTEYVRRRRLRIARRRHAIRQLRQVLPHLRDVDPRNEPLRVIVRVDETGDDRFSRDVDYLRAGRHADRTPLPDGDDAVVMNDDVRVLDDFLPFHRDHARTA